MSCSQIAGFISSFAVFPLRFDHSMDFRISLAHLVVSLIEPPFFSNTSGDLDCNTPVPTTMVVFLEIAQPVIQRLCRIILISAVNSWEAILGSPGPLKLIFSVDAVSSFTYLARYKLRQSRTISLLNL